MDLMPTKSVDEALVVGRPTWTAVNMEPWRGQYCPLRVGLPPTVPHSMSGDMGVPGCPENRGQLRHFLSLLLRVTEFCHLQYQRENP